MMVRPTLALASLLAAMAAGGQTVGDYVQRTPPAYQHDNTLFNKHPGSLQTPCVQWAVPYALGKLKLLLVLPADAAREGVELQERLSSDVTMITTKDHKTWGEPKTEFYSMVPVGDEITSLARLKLSPHNRYDAIVIGKFQWTAIPEEIRQLILSKVKGGAALVVVGPWDLEEDVVKALSASGLDGVRQSVPLASLPLDVDFEPLLPKSYAPRRIGPLEIRMGKLGGGTVACLDYHDMFYKNKSRIEGGGSWPYSVGLSTLALTPYLTDDPLFYDYYFSILGKVLLAATGKDSGVQALAETQPKTVERANLPAKVVEFKLSTASRDGQEFQLYYELRDRRGQVVGRGEETRALGKAAVGFSPEIPRSSRACTWWICGCGKRAKCSPGRRPPSPSRTPHAWRGSSRTRNASRGTSR